MFIRMIACAILNFEGRVSISVFYHNVLLYWTVLPITRLTVFTCFPYKWGQVTITEEVVDSFFTLSKMFANAWSTESFDVYKRQRNSVRN